MTKRIANPFHSVAIVAALCSLAFTARADSVVSTSPVQVAPPVATAPIAAAEALASDSATYHADLKAGAAAAVLATDAAKVNADLDSLARVTGVAATGGTLAKGWNYELALGGGAVGSLAFPNNPGVSLGGGGGGGVLFDFGFGKSTDSVDHYHVSLSLSLNSLTASSHTVAAVVLALMPSYQLDSTSPLLGFGPSLVCPTAHLQGVGTKCLAGVVFSSGFAAVLHSAGIGG